MERRYREKRRKRRSRLEGRRKEERRDKERRKSIPLLFTPHGTISLGGSGASTCPLMIAGNSEISAFTSQTIKISLNFS